MIAKSPKRAGDSTVLVWSREACVHSDELERSFDVQPEPAAPDRRELHARKTLRESAAQQDQSRVEVVSHRRQPQARIEPQFFLGELTAARVAPFLQKLEE